MLLKLGFWKLLPNTSVCLACVSTQEYWLISVLWPSMENILFQVQCPVHHEVWWWKVSGIWRSEKCIDGSEQRAKIRQSASQINRSWGLRLNQNKKPQTTRILKSPEKEQTPSKHSGRRIHSNLHKQQERPKKDQRKTAEMIIPVRCFTCGKIIGNKWETYLSLLQADFSEG